MIFAGFQTFVFADNAPRAPGRAKRPPMAPNGIAMYCVNLVIVRDGDGTLSGLFRFVLHVYMLQALNAA